MNRKKINILDSAKLTLRNEMLGLERGCNNLTEDFVGAVEVIADTVPPGRVIVIGMGKSGHIGNKIAATLASTGTPSFSVHPGEAGHGDLGMLTELDIVLGISQSGQSNELVLLLPFLRRRNIKLIAMTGNPKSDLAKNANFTIDTSVVKEACPLGLAPTTSTTLALALGDALAMCLLEIRGFTAEDFASTHPSGLLGRQLLLRVEDVMVTLKNLPTAYETDSIQDSLSKIASGKMGFIIVVDKAVKPIGVFTDGDLRRSLSKDFDIKVTPLSDVMTKDFSLIQINQLAIDAFNLMDKYKISAIPVVDEDKNLRGAISMQNLLDNGVL